MIGCPPIWPMQTGPGFGMGLFSWGKGACSIKVKYGGRWGGVDTIDRISGAGGGRVPLSELCALPKSAGAWFGSKNLVAT